MHGSDENQDSTLDIFKTPTPSTQKPTFIDKVEFDDVYDTWDDHDEGIIWENNYVANVTK